MTSSPHLFLFSVDQGLIRESIAAGVSGVIVDREHIGKERRQTGADTEINRHEFEDLRRVRSVTDGTVICRINNHPPSLEEEIAHAVDEGADEVILPMVRSVGEVEHVLELVGSRCGVGIMVETVAAVEAAPELARLPLSRAWLGVADLAIERGCQNIFTAFVDGTLELLGDLFECPFGWGGLTVVDLGYPVPCVLIMGEMARQRCDFTFLRRSFHRDIQGRDVSVEVTRIREALDHARSRPPRTVESERRAFKQAVKAWSPGWKLGGAGQHVHPLG